MSSFGSHISCPAGHEVRGWRFKMPTLPDSPWNLTFKLPSSGKLVDEIKATIGSLPPSHLALSAFAVGSFSTIATSLVYKRYFRRFRTSEWITPDVFTKRRWIRGVVTK